MKEILEGQVVGNGRELQVQSLRIEQLRPDPKNPRAHSDKQVRQIANSIETFGFNVPILIDKQRQVIAGHGRLLAARLLGWSEIPTISLCHLTDVQRRAFMIADNRLTENAEWDDRLLGEQLKSLAEAEIDFSLEITGFEMGEIDLFFEGLAPAQESEHDPGDTLPDNSNQRQVSRAGDLWQLGRHRVLCADALDPASCAALMNSDRAAMVFTDPPYNVPIDGHATGLGKTRHRDFLMASGELSPAEFTSFLKKALAAAAAHSVVGSMHYICMDWRHMGELLDAGNNVYTEFKNLCIWANDNAGMGSLYRSQHELVFVFKHGSESHRNNIRLGQFGRNRSNVWHYPGVNSFARSTEEGNLLDFHPTVKPVALVADAILDCSARGDVVLDPFLGSGTTIIAAERPGRICYGLELDPRYVDTIVHRWQGFTGKCAVQEASGSTFAEVEQEVVHALQE